MSTFLKLKGCCPQNVNVDLGLWVYELYEIYAHVWFLVVANKMQKKYNYALINTRLLQYIFEIRYDGIYFIT